MSVFYNSKKTRGIYDPAGSAPFKISRSKIELFTECRRCFYLDARLGVGRPPGFPFNLNSAVDALLKKEFDIHRSAATQHPLMKAYGIDAIPFDHENMDEWRENFKGVRYLHEPTNLVITGAVDDVWKDPRGELMVVDYKSTSKTTEVTIDAGWQMGYKRQMEVYQWLLRKNGFTVSDTGYFVYCNGNRDKEAFDSRLEFEVKIIPYVGNDAWVEKTLHSIKNTLDSDSLPAAGSACDYCSYRNAALQAEEALAF